MREKEINVFGIMTKVMLCRTNDGNKIMMRGLSEKDEEFIDSLSVNDKYKSIPKRDILMYGNINLRDGMDLDLIENSNFTDKEGSYIPANFDYRQGIIITVDGIVKGYHTTNSLINFKYNYCLLGKPKRIIIYIDRGKGKRK